MKQKHKHLEKSFEPKQMILLRPGTTPWSAWMRHYRQTGMGNFAKYCEQEGHVNVPAPYPPNSETSARQCNDRRAQ